jgi:hypothetical protein
VTREAALRAGMTPAMIKRRVAAGEWLVLGRSVYRVAGAPLTWEQGLLAACLLAGRGAVACRDDGGVALAAAVMAAIDRKGPAGILTRRPAGLRDPSPWAPVVSRQCPPRT